MAETEELVISRVIDAPIEQVWTAWTDPDLVKRWWGPDCFTSPFARIDFRQGGVSLLCMRAPQRMGGQDTYSTWRYQKIVPLQEIEYVHSLADQDGNKIDPTKLGLPPDFPQDMRHRVAFARLGSATELTVTEFGWKPGNMRNMAELGMKQCLDKMAAIWQPVA